MRAVCSRLGAFLGCGALGLLLATQWTAAHLGQPAALGPRLRLGPLWLYRPWAYLGWFWQWGNDPSPWGRTILTGLLFVYAGLGLGLLAVLAVRQRQGRGLGSIAYGSSRWARRDDIKEMGLYGKRR